MTQLQIEGCAFDFPNSTAGQLLARVNRCENWLVMMGKASNSRFRALGRSDATTAERFALRRCKTLAKDGPLSRPQEPEQGGLP
jgi:hypothetical protein